MKQKLNILVSLNSSSSQNGSVPILLSLDPTSCSTFGILSRQPSSLLPLSSRFATLQDTISNYAGILKYRLNIISLCSFLIHKSTALVIFVASVLVGAAFTVLSVTQSQQQASLVSAAISQASFSMISAYFTVLPPPWSRTLDVRYSVWFWGSVDISSLTCILSPAMYHRSPAADMMLSCVSSFVQIVCSLLLVECVEETVKAGSIGGIEARKQ